MEWDIELLRNYKLGKKMDGAMKKRKPIIKKLFGLEICKTLVFFLNILNIYIKCQNCVIPPTASPAWALFCAARCGKLGAFLFSLGALVMAWLGYY